MMDGAMRGALVAGPVLLLDRDELLTEILRRRAGTLRSERAVPRPPSTAELRRILGSIGKIDPARAHSLAELLFYTASSLSDESTMILTRRHQVCEQQSRIGEYIQLIKEEGEAGPANGYPLSKERELQSYIARGDKKNAQALLNEILGSVFFTAGRNPEVVKARVMELVVLLSRAALEGGADTEQIFGLNHTYLSQVSGFRSIDDIAYWLSEIMERFTDLVFDLKEIKHTDAMYKAISYIHRHHGERISLEDVAAQVRLSPAYFSKVFRREAGCTFRSYLNRVRIEKSKLLLRDGGMQLAEVAGLAGYEDQSYFTKVFKKFVGVSPGKYREAWNYYPTDTQEIHPDGVEK
jgi:YesN/AraC family two-component response regulator